MRINELNKPRQLSGVKSDLSKIKNIDSRDTSWQSLLNQAFQEYGFNNSGTGKYGTVFINSSYPYAIKIFMRDTAYMRWLRFCMNNQQNPYVPKIRGKVSKLTSIFYAVRIEKLKPIRGMHDSVDQFATIISRWEDDNSYRTNDENINSILDLFNKNSNIFDLHNENIMMRGDQVVIIDPFYNWFKPEKMDFSIDPYEPNPDVFTTGRDQIKK